MNRIGRFKYGNENMILYQGEYYDGNIAFVVYSEMGEPVSHISINIGEMLHLEPGEFVLNHNVSLLEGFIESFKHFFEDTGKKASFGYVKNQPIWRLKNG